MRKQPKDWPPKENWLSDGNEHAVTEGYLVGDRKGLESLQKAIQVALDTKDGEGAIMELRSPWSHVRVRSAHPEEEQRNQDSTLRARIVTVVGLSVLAVLLFLVVYGCYRLPELFRGN